MLVDATYNSQPSYVWFLINQSVEKNMIMYMKVKPLVKDWATMLTCIVIAKCQPPSDCR